MNGKGNFNNGAKMKLTKIIGKKVVAIKTYCHDKRKKRGFVPDYILFNDKKTLIRFVEEDYHSYIVVIEDPDLWNLIMADDEYYKDSDEDF